MFKAALERILLELALLAPIAGLEGTSSADTGVPCDEYVGRLASWVSSDRWSSGERVEGNIVPGLRRGRRRGMRRRLDIICDLDLA